MTVAFPTISHLPDAIYDEEQLHKYAAKRKNSSHNYSWTGHGADAL